MSPITASPASGRPFSTPCAPWNNSIHEEGNLKYDYFFDAQDPDALLLVESWTTPELQKVHCETEVFAKLQALKAQYCETVTIDKFNH